MLKRVIFLLIVVCFVSSVSAVPISLETAISIATRENLQLQVALRDVKIAEAQLNRAYSYLYPSVILEASQSRAESFQTRAVAEQFGSFFSTTPTSNSSSSGFDTIQDSYLAGVRGQWDFGVGTLASIGASSSGLEYAKNNYYSILNSTVYDIANDMLSVEISARSVAVLREAVQNLESHLKNVNIMFGQGVITKADVLDVQARLEERRSELAESERSLALTQDRFNLSIRQPLGTPVELSGGFEFALNSLKDVSANAKEFALATRPDYLSLDKQRHVLEATSAVYASSTWPQLSLIGYYGYGSTRQFEFSENNKDWRLTAAVQWTLFDGWRTASQVKETDLTIEKLDLQKELLSDSISLEVKDAELSAAIANRRLTHSRKTLELGLESLKIRQAQYTAGAATNQDVLDAELVVNQSKLSVVNSTADLLRAQLSYSKAVGNLYKIAGEIAF